MVAPNTERVLDIFLDDFDKAVIEHLSDAISDKTATGKSTKHFIANVDGVDVASDVNYGDDGVRLIWMDPEQPLEKFLIPVFIVSREYERFDSSRFHPDSLSYEVPAKGSKLVTVDMKQSPDRVEFKRSPEPYNLGYMIKAVGRTRRQMVDLNRHMMKRFRPREVLRVGVEDDTDRKYQTYQEGLADISTLTGITERFFGKALTFYVQAELDLHESENVATMITPQATVAEI